MTFFIEKSLSLAFEQNETCFDFKHHHIICMMFSIKKRRFLSEDLIWIEHSGVFLWKNILYHKFFWDKCHNISQIFVRKVRRFWLWKIIMFWDNDQTKCDFFLPWKHFVILVIFWIRNLWSQSFWKKDSKFFYEYFIIQNHFFK